MFEFNRESNACPACGTAHDKDNDLVGVDIREFDSESYIEDMVAMFAEHVTTEDQLRVGLKKVFLDGYLNGIQVYLTEEIQKKLEELNEAQTMLFDDK